MREFTKSLFSYSLAISLFPLQQMQNLLTPKRQDEDEGPATKAFSAVANVTTAQFGETLGSTFRMFDNVQRGLVSLVFSFFEPSQSRNRSDAAASTESSEPVRWVDVMPVEHRSSATEPAAEEERLVPIRSPLGRLT